MKKYLILLLALVGLAQWFVPLKMIWNKEEILRKGKSFRFETEPVDPEDPFRGRYVQLRFRADTARASARIFDNRENAYAELELDSAGYARIKQLHKKPPVSDDYIEVQVLYWAYDDLRGVDSNKAIVQYPFDQFFLDEYKAPKAEKIYNEARRDSSFKTYAVVNIYQGKGVIKDLVVNDKPINSYFK